MSTNTKVTILVYGLGTIVIVAFSALLIQEMIVFYKTKDVLVAVKSGFKILFLTQAMSFWGYLRVKK